MRNVRLVNIWDIFALQVKRDVLRESPLFEGMSPFQIKKVILLSEISELKRHDTLIERGDFGREMYMILSGSAVVCIGEGDERHEIATVHEGDVIGEVAFVQNVERTATVIAQEDLEVLVFSYDKVKKTTRLYPGVAAKLNLNIAKILGERLAKTNEKVLGA